MIEKKKNMLEEIKEETKKEIKEAQLVEVPTGSARAFMLEDESIVTTDELLVKMYNMLSKITKEVVA